MALLSLGRGQPRPSPGAGNGLTPRDGRERRPAPGADSALRDSLQHLYALRPSREGFAEEAVKLIAQIGGVTAVALLDYESRDDQLRLLATAGLPPDAVEAIGGSANGTGWDIPLRGLRNRRINVIEAAHENPFVPKPLVAINPRCLTIAALPFYHANLAIGVLVLFAPTPRGFSDGLLHTLSHALNVCALALSELPSSREAGDRDDAAEQPVLLRGLAALKDELARLTHALEEAERQRTAEVTERVTAQSFLAAERERAAGLERQLATAQEQAQVAVAAIETLTARRDALQQQLEEARAAAAADAGRLRTEAQQELLAVRAELAQVTGHRQELAAEVASLTDQLARLRTEFSDTNRRHETEARERAAELERLTQALAEKDLLLRSVEERLTTIRLAETDTAAAAVLDIHRSSPVGHDGAAANGNGAAQVAKENGARQADEMALVDAFDTAEIAAQRLSEFGHRVAALVPDHDLPARLAERQVTCAAINLAIPAAWETVRTLRNGHGLPHTPLVAYALPAGSKMGFWFGTVDFAVLPATDNLVADTLLRMVPRLKRVIAMSNDLDVMSDVRTQLTSARVSTAIVLDGRQALDLLPTIQPEAAVLHVSPGCVDVFRAIAGLRSRKSSRDIPILFLLDHDAEPREEAFLNAGVRMLTGQGNLASDALVNSLASAFDTYRTA